MKNEVFTKNEKEIKMNIKDQVVKFFKEERDLEVKSRLLHFINHKCISLSLNDVDYKVEKLLGTILKPRYAHNYDCAIYTM